ncbi:MAG: chemotaxis response regulator protein-glutamate methylesterase [Opitutaceae bacterium]|jgi:two-component system chemotaxis response regulator CheB
MTSPAKKIRVFVVDDSAVVRRMVADALSADPDIEVVGTAMDPYIARNKLKDLQPDVMTLDIEMPRMDGLTFLQLIMDHRPMPVIIMSSLSQKGSQTALEALRMGAVEVLGKPGDSTSFGALGPQLIEKVKAAAIAKVRRRNIPRPEETGKPIARPSLKPGESVFTSSTPPPVYRPPQPKPVIKPPTPAASEYLCKDPRALILLGASTGGTEALTDILIQLPNTLPPIAVVQHIPSHFSLAFAQRLNKLCKLEVREAVDGDWLVPGLALIAPGNYHMMVQRYGDRHKVRITDGPMVWHQRPAVDLLFKSAAEYGPHALAGLLTGMGKDGAEGLLRLRERGASTFSQDEASSIVYGMPRAAWECGASQRQLPLDQMAEYIIRTVSNFPESPAQSASPFKADVPPPSPV